MSYSGRIRRVEILVNGDTIVGAAKVDVSESIEGGMRVRFEIKTDPLPRIELGDEIRLIMHPYGYSMNEEVEYLAWCNSIEFVSDGTAGTIVVSACDPLGFYFQEPQYRTYAGGKPISTLLQEVLLFVPNGTGRNELSWDGAPRIPQEWLFQCNETGSEFIDRIAASIGHLVFWRGTGYSSGIIGRGLETRAPMVHLSFDEGLVSIRHSRNPEIGQHRDFWTDPVTRQTQVLQCRGSGTGRDGRSASKRICSVNRPESAWYISAYKGRDRGDTIIAETVRPDITPGMEVEFPDDHIKLVEKVHHTVWMAGTYMNICECVTRERWGIVPQERRTSTAGIFQAVVTDSDDPSGLGRIRAILCDDPGRRKTPWLPCIHDNSGQGRGIHWLPDKGDYVLLEAENACPENLYCIGSIRGKGKEIDRKWKTKENTKKVIAAENNISIVFDEESRTMRFESGEASLELRGNGEVILNGNKLDIDMKEHASLYGGNTIKVDAGQRIDLG